MKEQLLNLESPWPTVKEKIKEANIDITDEDLDYEPGKESELFDRLGSKLSMNHDEVRSWIESVSANKGKAS